MPNEEKDDMTLLAEAHERLTIAYLKLLRAYKDVGERLYQAESKLFALNAPCRNGNGSGPKRYQPPAQESSSTT